MTWLEIVIQLVAAAVGTICFVCMYGVQRWYYVWCGIVGAAGWVLYFCLGKFTILPVTLNVFLATMLITFLSRMISVWKRCPVTVFLIAGIFPLVPGAGIYWTAYYLVTDQIAEARSSGFAAIKAAIAIVIGIVVILEIPNQFFHLIDPYKKAKQKERVKSDKKQRKLR